MGRPPRRFPRANGIFCTPHSDHGATANMDAIDEQPLHLQRDMTHETFRRFLEARKELAELASGSSSKKWPRGPQKWYGQPRQGRGGMGSSVRGSFCA